jgi:Uma2 family endonuclease
LRDLGNIDADRVLATPPPGNATPEDVEACSMPCELIDGTLVVKAMGYRESWLASILSGWLFRYLDEHDLGITVGEGGTLTLRPGLVRIPDVGFIAWERFPGEELPVEAMPLVAPDLAVEILRRGNTEAEMQRKLREYFGAGSRLVWIVDPKTRTARAFNAPETWSVIGEDGVLDGADVLPGFRVSMNDWFERARRRRGKRS